MQDGSFRINTPIPYAVPLNIGKDGKEREFGRASENAVRREEAAAAGAADVGEETQRRKKGLSSSQIRLPGN